MPISLSVVMPAYNEEAAIKGAVGDVVASVFSALSDAELVVVDDGSSDRTPKILEELSQADDRVKVVRQENAGHGAALIRGVETARGTAMLLIDSDRQIDLDDFAAHWARFKEDDLELLLGIRRPRHDPFHRLIISKAMKMLIGLRFKGTPVDAGVPYKIVSRKLWDDARPAIGGNSIIPSVLLAVFASQRIPNRLAEVTVTHRARTGSTSTLRFLRLYRFCKTATRELLSFRPQQ